MLKIKLKMHINKYNPYQNFKSMPSETYICYTAVMNVSNIFVFDSRVCVKLLCCYFIIIMVSVSPVHLPLGQSCMSMKTMYMNIWYANMVHCRWKLCLKREMLQCPTSPETLSNWLMLQAQSHAITAWQRLCPYYVVQTQQLSFMINSWSVMFWWPR